MRMILVNGTIHELHGFLGGRKLAGFGASVMPKELCDDFPYYHFEEKFQFFMDNDSAKQGTSLTLKGRAIPVLSPEQGARRMDRDTVLLITSLYYLEILEQLKSIPAFDETICLLLPLLEQYTPVAFSVGDHAAPDRSPKIPATIHYCWFGKTPIPPADRECIESWKTHCPDIPIREWNESNYDVAAIPYMKEAYEAKKWAFVSDVARLDIIYRHGGLYFDTDVQLVRGIHDLLLLDGFCGFDMYRDVNTGLGFGAHPRNRLVGEMRDMYRDLHFLRSDGSYDETPCTKIQTRLLKSHGLVTDGSLQRIDNLTIFPVEFLCPMDLWSGLLHITENTRAIHRFGSSWWSDEKKETDAVKRRMTAELLSTMGRLEHV